MLPDRMEGGSLSAGPDLATKQERRAVAAGLPQLVRSGRELSDGGSVWFVRKSGTESAGGVCRGRLAGSDVCERLMSGVGRCTAL
jgi:hypothetical protein